MTLKIFKLNSRCFRFPLSNILCAMIPVSYLSSAQRWHTSKRNCSDAGKKNDTYTVLAGLLNSDLRWQSWAVCRQVNFTLRATHWSKHSFSNIHRFIEAVLKYWLMSRATGDASALKRGCSFSYALIHGQHLTNCCSYTVIKTCMSAQIYSIHLTIIDIFKSVHFFSQFND